MKLKYGLLLVFVVLVTACLEKKEILEVSTHPTGWMLQTSDNFHGNAVQSSILASESCQTCHGDNYDGGTSQVSCYDAQCHATYPHPEGMLDFTSDNFHGNFIRERVNWDIIVCQECHGADYAGMGDSDKNCTKCHTQADGPEACNTCHGSRTGNFAPPEDLLGNEETTSIGVGAHQSHLTESDITTAYQLDCNICHITPAIYDMDGHVDDSTPHAELNFNEFAASGGLSPDWDRDAATCSNVYCHGAFSFSRDSSQYAWVYTDSVISGNYSNVVWNSVGTNQAACGTCHGLPPAGHFAAITECGNCHYHIGEGLEILDKDLHINGKIEVY